MTTILTVGNSEGERTCNAKCYDAKGPVCTCCCGGKNHGVGLKAAIEGNQAFVDWLDALGLKVVADDKQIALPGVEL